MTMEATVGIEPTIRVLQTRALPLGYVAPPPPPRTAQYAARRRARAVVRSGTTQYGSRTIRFTGSATMDAIALLTQDHREVEALFQQFEGESDPVRRRDVGDTIMAELTAHAEAEATFVY